MQEVDDNQVDQNVSDQQQPEFPLVSASSQSKTDAFFQTRTITSVNKLKPKRKFVPPFVTGNLFKKTVIDVLQDQASKKQKVEQASKKQKVAAKSTKLKLASKSKKSRPYVSKKLHAPRL